MCVVPAFSVISTVVDLLTEAAQGKGTASTGQLGWGGEQEVEKGKAVVWVELHVPSFS